MYGRISLMLLLTVTIAVWSFASSISLDSSPPVSLMTRAAVSDGPPSVDIDNDTRAPSSVTSDFQMATIFVSPKEIIGSVGEIITINITIKNVTSLYAWQMGMTFNPEVLQCEGNNVAVYHEGELLEGLSGTSGMREGPFLKSVATEPTYGTVWVFSRYVNRTQIELPFDNKVGIIYAHGCSLLADAPGASGSGTLATVTFKVIGTGTSELRLDGANLSIKLINANLKKIPYTLEQGYFKSERATNIQEGQVTD